jgi:glyoxylate/hydroxypyruvate reductase A
MTLLVAITQWEVAPWLARFRQALPGRRVVTLDEHLDPASIPYVACWKHPPGSLAALTTCRALFSLGAGVDHLISDPALPAAPIIRVVDPDLTRRMVEWVVWQVLDQHRQGPRYRAQQARREWIDDRHQPAAGDVRVGIMGMGELGRAAAEALVGLGFRVAGWSRTPKPFPGVEGFSGQRERDAFLARTDILVCLLPLTDETRGILNARLIDGLARDGRTGGPILINAGRGGLQVETDILAALDNGLLKAAALDVFEAEPLPPASPLWSHPAVTITPHNAAMSAPDAIAAAIARQIARIEAGEPPEHVVERGRGY